MCHKLFALSLLVFGNIDIDRCFFNNLCDWVILFCSQFARIFRTETTYVIDEIARKYGHEVMRTPPYHPELQPIETCWGVVKNHIARNCNFTMKDLIDQLENGFEQVTSITYAKIIAKAIKTEDQFWLDDISSDA